MTDQPKHGNDRTPGGYQPPSQIPSGESGASASPGDPYGQPTSPYPAAYGQPTQPSYAKPAGQPYSQYPYGAPGQPYGQPGSPYNPYGRPAYYGMAPEPKSLSIASLCCGIAAFMGLGFFILPQVAAVILGHLALTREPSGKGMAIAGLVLGYVAIALTVLVIVIISIVASSMRHTGSAV